MSVIVVGLLAMVKEIPGRNGRLKKILVELLRQLCESAGGR